LGVILTKKDMKLITLIVACLISCNLFGQKLDKKDLHKYFIIKGVQIEYQGAIYKNIYPAIKKDTIDLTSRFLNIYKRRFEYVLMNKTSNIFRDSTFQSLFPDTTQMSKIYCEKLSKDKLVLGYLNAFINPNQNRGRRIGYTKSELMEVASRFFLCESVNPDTTIFWHVCIGISGQAEAGWVKDFTLLEAFCFEAIFDGLQSKDKAKSSFMDNFMSYVKEAELQYKNLSFELILEKARNDVFKKMEYDTDLERVLLDYYEYTKDKLPFTIQ
jgi:hypothetical protein